MNCDFEPSCRSFEVKIEKNGVEEQTRTLNITVTSLSKPDLYSGKLIVCDKHDDRFTYCANIDCQYFNEIKNEQGLNIKFENFLSTLLALLNDEKDGRMMLRLNIVTPQTGHLYLYEKRIMKDLILLYLPLYRDPEEIINNMAKKLQLNKENIDKLHSRIAVKEEDIKFLKSSLEASENKAKELFSYMQEIDSLKLQFSSQLHEEITGLETGQLRSLKKIDELAERVILAEKKLEHFNKDREKYSYSLIEKDEEISLLKLQILKIQTESRTNSAKEADNKMKMCQLENELHRLLKEKESLEMRVGELEAESDEYKSSTRKLTSLLIEANTVLYDMSERNKYFEDKIELIDSNLKTKEEEIERLLAINSNLEIENQRLAHCEKLYIKEKELLETVTKQYEVLKKDSAETKRCKTCEGKMKSSQPGNEKL